MKWYLSDKTYMANMYGSRRNMGQMRNTLCQEILKEKYQLVKTSVSKRKALEQIRIK
jgi:hypothetical protein